MNRKRCRPASLAGELVRMLTGDGLELHGFLSAPARARAAVVHVHGWDGNFYENRFVYEAGRTAVRQGYGFFTFNNRGHDYIADILRDRGIQNARVKMQEPRCPEFEYLQLGGVYEKLADSVADIAAALDFLEGRGFRRFILQGHSHGAIKVTNYLYRTRDPRVRGLSLLSPSDDLGWGRALMGRKFAPALARARRLAGRGRGRELLPEGTFQYPVSAGTFVDCFAPESIAGTFNVSRTGRKRFPELAAVTVPVLVAVGTVDEAFAGDPAAYVAAIDELLVGVRSFTGAVIDGAPHNYLGREAELAEVLGSWLGRMRKETG